MKNDHHRSDAPTGAARAVRTARDLANLARKIVPAYARGNAQVEGYIKVARDKRDGAMIAPERSADPMVRLSLGAFEPLARALATGFDVGPLLTGNVSNESVELGFDALESRTTTTKKSATVNERGGILAVLAIDEDGAPVERSGAAQPDARTASEIARALDRLRRDLQTARFQAELTFARGSALVRAAPRATVVVVVEAGVDLRRLAALVPDAASYHRTDAPAEVKAPHVTASVAAPETVVAKPVNVTNGTKATNGANGTKAPSVVKAANGSNGHAYDGSRPSVFAVGAADGKKHTGFFGGMLAEIGDRTVRRVLGDTTSTTKRGRDTGPGSRTTSAAATPSPIARTEVEDTGTRLLRAAEDYIGPRTLDRLIAETAPRAFAWQNRRVVVRGDERVALGAANDVYKEIRGLFGRGAAVSDALRDFDYGAWLTAQHLPDQHAGVARAALVGGTAA